MPNIDVSLLDILIVDDNATNRGVLSEQLQQWGAQVTQAKNSYEALTLCEEKYAYTKNIFDIGLLDMQMPVMDGAELGQKIKMDARFSPMKLVMMTSLHAYGDASRMAALGFSAYFPKPATNEDLFAALNVVGDDGDALERAFPLVTKEYLESIKNNINHTNTSGLWPEHTRVLVVEDNQINQQVAIGLLEDFGLTAEIADDGALAVDALIKAKDSPYTLVLMDCQMPVLNGYDATDAIRNGKAGKHAKDVVIIAMTANAMEGDREKCLDVGMNDYLAKPVDAEFLFAKLKHWLCGINHVKDEQEKLDENHRSVWAKHKLSKRLKGRESIVLKLTKMFAKDYLGYKNAIQKLLSEGAFDLLYEELHTLSGVAANLSAEKLSDCCAKSMEAISNTKKETIALSSETLLVELEAFYFLIKDYNKASETPASTKSNPTQ